MLKTMRVVVVTLLLTLVVSGVTSAQTERRQVWAYYFGWWGQDSWNDGRLVDKPAQPYSSFDAGAVGRQIDEAKGAGIDAFVMKPVTLQVLASTIEQVLAQRHESPI